MYWVHYIGEKPANSPKEVQWVRYIGEKSANTHKEVHMVVRAKSPG